MKSNEANGTLVGNAFPCLQYFVTEQLHGYLSPLCNIPQTELAFLGFFSQESEDEKLAYFKDTWRSRLTSVKAHSFRAPSGQMRLGKCGVGV